jgi:hypothetical protein
VTLSTHKTPQRQALERPFSAEHERSIARIAAEPRNLTEGIRALRRAVNAEMVGALHQVDGVESDPGTTPRVIAQSVIHNTPLERSEPNADYRPKSAWLNEKEPLSTPRWSHDFRTYITGSYPFATDVAEDGVMYYVRPLASSLARMENSSSGRDRLAARTVHALPFHRYHPEETWWALVGKLANREAEYMARTWAEDALKRWWGYYVQMPQGRALPT